MFYAITGLPSTLSHSHLSLLSLTLLARNIYSKYGKLVYAYESEFFLFCEVAIWTVIYTK